MDRGHIGPNDFRGCNRILSDNKVTDENLLKKCCSSRYFSLTPYRKPVKAGVSNACYDSERKNDNEYEK